MNLHSEYRAAGTVQVQSEIEVEILCQPDIFFSIFMSAAIFYGKKLFSIFPRCLLKVRINLLTSLDGNGLILSKLLQ